jgi:putative FmdB family regulatory protein
MPTYEYECEKCGNIFEEFQSINAEPLKNCKKTGCDGTIKRLFSSGAGFIFKGSGFYITDYRSDSYKKGAKSDGTSSTSSTSSSTSSSNSSSKSTSTPS